MLAKLLTEFAWGEGEGEGAEAGGNQKGHWAQEDVTPGTDGGWKALEN